MSFKKTIIPLFICGIVLCLCSCAKEDEFEMPTLVLSESSVSFDKGVGERTISVTTNQNSWIASSPQEGDWLSLVQDGNVLKVKVAENKMGTERISHVIVNANGATGKIEVRQSAADVTLDVVPTAIYLPQSGGEKVVDVTTNTSAYDVVLSEDVTWLKIIKGDEEIKLVAERNDSYLNREVKLYAKSGNQTREIVVSQSGIQRFVLPINPGLPQDVHKIMEYELGRGSYLREYQSAMPAYGLEEMYTFITPSPIFTLMQYSSADGITPSQIITVGDGATAVEAVKDKAFAKFLADNGYVRSNSSSDREYVNDKELLALKVYISEKVGNQGVNLTFTPVMKQVGDYKTFDRLPYYPLELLQDDNVKLAQVEKYEQDAGSKEEERSFNENKNTEVSQLQYTLKANSDASAPYSRIHIFYTTGKDGKSPAKLGSVQIGALLFKDTSLGLWKYGNKWVVTNEFKKKLGDEGFSYLRSAGNTHYFVRERDHLLIAVLSVVDNNVPVLALLYNYDASVQGAGTKALKAQNKMVSNFVAATKALKF
ncbi:BACON domain-containing protein [Hoylesella shahii]|uniref:BACON domain-containing protein n=1 Tax=Hoylesella shahii TaxID=228603 RepID=UPI00288972AE|nr:BACON domain-containing protein [Hoylesella shahii]